MQASEKKMVEFLKEQNVKVVKFRDGKIEYLEYQDIADQAVLEEVQRTLAKWDADYEAMTPEERQEHLMYGHAL